MAGQCDSMCDLDIIAEIRTMQLQSEKLISAAQQSLIYQANERFDNWQYYTAVIFYVLGILTILAFWVYQVVVFAQRYTELTRWRRYSRRTGDISPAELADREI